MTTRLFLEAELHSFFVSVFDHCSHGVGRRENVQMLFHDNYSFTTDVYKSSENSGRRHHGQDQTDENHP